VLLCRRVAAHVQADTIPLAINPGLMLRLAVLNSSLVLVENLVYRFWPIQLEQWSMSNEPS
jgi:hypothetical protein